MAWMFLEDAEKLGMNPSMSYGAFTMHLERYLSGAAIFLRRACEAHYGRGKLKEAPDQQAMEFITAARHIGSHAVADAIHGHTKSFEMNWNNERQAGEVHLAVNATIDFDADPEASPQRRDQAKRYLAKHSGDVFLALHSAAEAIARWTGARVDDDFSSLRQAKLGHVRLRAEFTDPEAFRQFASVATSGGQYIFGDEKSLQIVGLES